MAARSSVEEPLADNDRWCLRCLTWYATMDHRTCGQEFNADFTCESVGKDKCERCRKLDVECLTIPPTVWGNAQEIIARRGALLKLPPNDLSTKISTAANSLTRAFFAVQSGTQKHYSRDGNLQQEPLRQTEDERKDGNDDRKNDQVSNFENQDNVESAVPAIGPNRPRRAVRPVSSYAEKEYEPFKEIGALVAPSNKKSNSTSGGVKDNSNLSSNASAAVARFAPIHPEATRAPAAVQASAAAAAVANPTSPRRLAQVVYAVDEVSRLTAARNEAARRLGEAVFEAIAPGGPGPPRVADGHIDNVLQMLRQATQGNVVTQRDAHGSGRHS
ncbi:uncharacterized protein CTRU02_207725 [Colletotrichum truncatum]|uniref:Uncharacterized protein n=1 Tax=Colletotrichum truncatum TaxID=5467 RepID=A0ACC3Z1S3_COLTU